jgi:HAD superfamily hydrolase (TIGR01549 family)
MSSHQVDEAVVAFRSKLALVLKDGTPLYPGAEALLKKLKHLGFDIGIATMKPNDLAEQMIKISPIKDLITAVQGSTGIEPKPNPEVLNRIKQKVDCRPLIMVGDRFEDLDCAKNANSPSIGIGQTVVSKLDLELRGAFAAYDNLLDMHEDLEQLLLRVSLKFKRP